MEIGIVTIAYNGYGKFLEQWLDSIYRLKHRPKKVTIVLGKNHGVDDPHIIQDWIKVIKMDSDNMGELRNVGVKYTESEWIMMLDIDDEILPWAITEFEKVEKNADIIVAPYINLADISLCVSPKINKEVLFSQEYYMNGKNFMHGGIPFRRKLWEKYKYQENECANSLFWIDCAKQGPRFRPVPIPCLTYNRRTDSHSSVGNAERNKRFEIINNYRKSKI